MDLDNKVEVDATEENVAESFELMSSVNIPVEVRQEIEKKAAELKAQHKLRKIFVVLVEGEEADEKPFYIAYMRRPGLAPFSKYMNFVQKDLVQANKMLAADVFLAGDRELVDDDDLFLYGTMSQLAHLIDSRNAELVKK